MSKPKRSGAIVKEALEEALELLMLCDPNGDRVKAFGANVPEDAEVKALCERHGYGAVMDSAARQWRLVAYGEGSHTTGPAVASVKVGVNQIREALLVLKPKRKAKR